MARQLLDTPTQIPLQRCSFDYYYLEVTWPIAGAYESLKAAKEHETYTICQVPSQSKFIAKYFPYKESKILLFEAIHGMRVMAQTTMTENFLESSCTTEDFVSIVDALFFLNGVTVLTSTSCCTSSHSISHEVSVSITKTRKLRIWNFQIL